MSTRAYISRSSTTVRRSCWMAAVLLIPLLQAAAGAGQTPGLGPRVVLDRVVAVVNGDLILESDLEAEERFAAFQPFNEPNTSRDKLIDRLIDRQLILQQLRLQPEPPIMDEQVDAQLAVQRKAIPACAAYQCETDAGWAKFLADHGVTLEELRDRARLELQVLQFVDQRFRMGIRVLPAEIDAYYQKTLVPAYQKEKVAPPDESKVSDRIKEILLQERVTSLLDDWLKTLRAQGSVSIVKPLEATP